MSNTDQVLGGQVKIGWVRTYTGKYVNVLRPQPEMICREDIAHHLAHETRWGGACSRFYSVAEHSIWVSRIVQELVPLEFKEIASLYGLLHDAHEAYLKDIPTPIKMLLGEPFQQACERLDISIWAHFGLTAPDDDVARAIKQADRHAAWSESVGLLAHCKEHKGLEEPPLLIRDSLQMHEQVKEPHAPQRVEASFLSFLNYSLRIVQ